MAALRFQARSLKARPSDFEAIEVFAKARALHVISIEQRYNPWPYWLRGHLLISNLARIFVVTADSGEGGRRELHVVFDSLGKSGGSIHVLREIASAP